MKISARNQFQGNITAVHPGSVHTEIEIALGNGDTLVAMVTHSSAHSLGLTSGKSVLALVKASSMMVMTESEGYALSARNVLRGVVAQVISGPVSAEVKLDLPGGNTVFASITHAAARELGLSQGARASVVFKASAVILAVAS